MYNHSYQDKDFHNKERDKDELKILRKYTREESFQEFSFKARSDSLSSVDQKDMTFYRQYSNQLRGESSARGSMFRLENSFSQTKPSGFLVSKMESQLKRYDTMGDRAQTSNSEYKIRIENLPRSAEDLGNLVSSRSSLKNDNSPTDTPGFDEKEKQRNSLQYTFTNNTNLSRYLLVVPEESRVDESSRGDISKRGTSKTLTSDGSITIFKADRGQIESNPKVQKSWVLPSIQTNGTFTQAKLGTKESVASNPNEEYKINITNVSSDDEHRVQHFPTIRSRIRHNSMDGSNIPHNIIRKEQSTEEIIKPVRPRKNSADKVVKINTPYERKDSLGMTQSQSKARQVKPAGQYYLSIPEQMTGSRVFIEESKDSKTENSTTLQSNDNSMLELNPKNNVGKDFSEGNSKLKQDSRLAVSYMKADNLKVKAKKKFSSNLLDMVSSKKVSSPIRNEPKVAVKPPMDYTDETSNLSIRTLHKLPVNNAKKRGSDEIFCKLGDGYQGIVQVEEWGIPPKLQGLNNLEFMKETDTISPIAREESKESNTIQPRHDLNLNFHKTIMDISRYTEDHTIYDMEDGLSNYDFDNYNFYEEVKEIEIDEERGINVYNGTGYLRPKPPSNHQSIKMSHFGSRRGTLSKSKSVNYDELGGTTSLGNSPLLQGRTMNRQEDHLKLAIYAPNSTSIIASPTNAGNPNLEESPSNGGQISPQLRRRLYTQGRQTKSQVIAVEHLDKAQEEKRINQYLLGEEFGKGILGQTKMALNSDTQIVYAAKIISKEKFKSEIQIQEENGLSQMHAEIAVMKKIDHPNIVRLYQIIDNPDDNNFYFIMELVGKEGMAASQYFTKGKKSSIQEDREDIELSTDVFGLKNISQEKARHYMRDLLLATDYMHNCVNMTHGDLKPGNLLVTTWDLLKVSDYNIIYFAESPDFATRNKVGFESFWAPEQLSNSSSRSKPADIWSLGALLYYFIFGKCPFVANNPYELKRKILEDPVEFPQSDDIHPNIINIINGCLQKDPNKRFSLRKMMEDPWVTENGNERLANKGTEPIEVTEQDISFAFTQKMQYNPNLRSRKPSLRPSRFSQQGSGLNIGADLHDSPNTTYGEDKNESERKTELAI